MNEEDLDLRGLDTRERALLAEHGFDHASFMRLRRELAAGEFPPSRNIETSPLTPPSERDLITPPPQGSREAQELEHLGSAAIAEGKVAVVVLNGGMATRFGGGVKGVVEVCDGKSFIALRLLDVARACGPVPVFLMSSFATAAATRDHLAQSEYFGLPPARVCVFTQGISMRLTPEGELARDHEGRVSFYAPGHGDLFERLAATREYQSFVERGGKHVVVSNVDNLGARLSPLMLGAHIAQAKPITVEVTRRLPKEPGGAPARLLGRLQVIENFRFPPSFDQDSISVCNTNTMIVDTSAVRADYPLTWFRVDKTAGGANVVQFERLMGQATAFCDSSYIVVPRTGPESRFLPVKTPDDLLSLKEMVPKERCS